MKFRLRKGKGSVSGFTDAKGVTHVPGEVVDLPPSYRGEKWLEVVNKTVAKPMVPISLKSEELDVVPLPEKEEKRIKKPAKKK